MNYIAAVLEIENKDNFTEIIIIVQGENFHKEALATQLTFMKR